VPANRCQGNGPSPSAPHAPGRLRRGRFCGRGHPRRCPAAPLEQVPGACSVPAAERGAADCSSCTRPTPSLLSLAPSMPPSPGPTPRRPGTWRELLPLAPEECLDCLHADPRFASWGLCELLVRRSCRPHRRRYPALNLSAASRMLPRTHTALPRSRSRTTSALKVIPHKLLETEKLTLLPAPA
jgi:hypothetical protein